MKIVKARTFYIVESNKPKLDYIITICLIRFIKNYFRHLEIKDLVVIIGYSLGGYISSNKIWS